jgi:hypothetical protein
MKDIKKINGNYCIKLLNECIYNSSNTYQEEWSKLKWENGIDLETMCYNNAIKIAKILGLDKNSVENVIFTLNNKYYNRYNKNISYSVKMTFEAIKYKISKPNIMKGGDISEGIKDVYINLQEVNELLRKSNKKINKNDLLAIHNSIANKILIDKKFFLVFDLIFNLKEELENNTISIPDEMTELTLMDIKKLLETVK